MKGIIQTPFYRFIEGYNGIGEILLNLLTLFGYSEMEGK